MSDLLERMRATLQRGKDTRQLAVPIDLEDLEKLIDSKIRETELEKTCTELAAVLEGAARTLLNANELDSRIEIGELMTRAAVAGRTILALEHLVETPSEVTT